MKRPIRNVVKSVQTVDGVTKKRFVNVQSATWDNIVRLHFAIHNVWMVVFAQHQQFAAAQEAIKEGIVKEVWILYFDKLFRVPKKNVHPFKLHSAEPRKNFINRHLWTKMFERRQMYTER